MVDKDTFYDVNKPGAQEPVAQKAAETKPADILHVNEGTLEPTTVVADNKYVADLVSDDDSVNAASLTTKLNQGDHKMAEIDTTMLSTQHSDIRHEQAAQAATIRQEQAEQACDLAQELGRQHSEILKEDLRNSFNIRGDVKDASTEVSDRVEDNADRITRQATDFYIAGQAQDREAARDLANLSALTNASRNETLGELHTGLERNAAAVALESQKSVYQNAQGQHDLYRLIGEQNEKTRDLINDHKYHDLNRALVERNNELVDCRDRRDHWRGVAEQSQYGSQFAQLQTMMQNFGSQLNETRQGMVNLGTMNGVGQTSTNNNI